MGRLRGYDLHVHTTRSDGKETPKRVVEIAFKEKNLQGIAITDHNTIEGIDEAVSAAESCNNFQVIPGVELSAELSNKKYNLNLDVHLLFYFFDRKSKDIKNFFTKIEVAKLAYAIKVVDGLKRENILTDQEAKEQFEKRMEDCSLRKEHIISYLKKEKGIVERACHTKIKLLRLEEYRPSIEEAIEIFRIPMVIAHPGLIIDERNEESNDDKLIDFSILEEILIPHKKNIVGLEGEYPYHKVGRVIPEFRTNEGEDSARAKIRDFSSSRYYNEKSKALAKRLKAMYVGGSDCHSKPQLSEIGDCITPSYIVKKLRKAITGTD